MRKQQKSIHCLISKDSALNENLKRNVITQQGFTNMRTEPAEVTATGELLKSLVALLLWKKRKKHISDDWTYA